MDIFVARQPILTKEEEIIGYELLYRNSRQNSFTEIDGDVATTDLLVNSFLGIGNEKLSKGKKLFINFTRNLLLKRVPSLFSPEKIIIEILEDVEGDEEVIEAVSEFKALGYTIALDDFLLKDLNKNLLPYADIIKVDFLSTSKKQREAIEKIAKFYNATLLAEKIETRADFEAALHEGYTYFQGYFFSKPVIVSAADIPFTSFGYLRILNELNEVEPDIDKITSFIEYDLSLSFKILKFVNTTSTVKITSIKQAIMILGLNELFRWLTIISLKEQQPKTAVAEEILLQSLIRGKFAELFGMKHLGLQRKAECFMVGMFSLLDTILQRPMEKILETLPLSEAVKNALVKDESELAIILDITEAVEQANWEKLNSFGFLATELSSCYETALNWTNDIFEELK
ncbi:EAL domain-containing protein [Anaerobacillus alkaliphilus]|uniref:EAL domain-containing protein n=1 Tax=Anaerobacillus alkaliphilus TaxID=1548597 RepID=A0A4Q0VXW5_9BACI|nr:EAL domain-containing protein [Anaerobacillus alkaliphilus]RXJ02608.1 EAL domain-containing protein [Anaerobacillus alkaliphilus]